MPRGCAAATKIMLPGVGHFGQMMRALDDAGRARHAAASASRAGVPFLGICLGLQALFESSEEAPEVRGLGVYPGHGAALSAGRARAPHGLERAGSRAAIEAAARTWTPRPYRLLRPQLLRARRTRAPAATCTYDAAVHGGARSGQRLRRAVPPGEIGPGGTADRAEFSWNCAC